MVGAHTRGEPRTTPMPTLAIIQWTLNKAEALGPESFSEDLGLFSQQGLVVSWAEVAACMSSRDSRNRV